MKFVRFSWTLPSSGGWNGGEEFDLDSPSGVFGEKIIYARPNLAATGYIFRVYFEEQFADANYNVVVNVVNASTNAAIGNGDMSADYETKTKRYIDLEINSGLLGYKLDVVLIGQ